MIRSRGLLPTLFGMLIALILAVAAPSAAAAQTGRISGTITDSTHAVLAGTQVTVMGTRMNSVSDGSGHYSIGGLPAGSYDVRVQRLGQRARVIPAVAVRAGEDTRVDRKSVV